MKFVIRFTALLSLLALGACGGGSKDAAPPGGGNNGPPPPVVTAPTITAQPVAQTVTEPAAATISVTASGTAPFTYQWRSSTDGTSWTNIAGATAASYDTGATSVGMSGRYYSVVVTNSAGSATSANAQLTVTAAPPTGGGGGGPSGEFPHAANPAAVAVTRADSAVAGFDVVSSGSASVQVPGGAADVTVAEGITVTFGVPGDAFLEDQTLVVTPVTLAGTGSDPLPFQSVAGAFDLGSADTTAPELQLRNGVVITFTFTPAALDALGGQPVIFAARTDGTQLHLMPVFRNPDGTWATTALTTSVAHLGIFGIATLTAEQSTALGAAWPAYDDFQLEAAVAPASYGLRAARLAAPAFSKARVVSASDDPDDWAAQMQARADAYYNDVVVPALDAARAPDADVALFRDATQKALAWERMRQLLDLQDERDSGVMQQLRDLASRGLDEALQDCAANRSGAATAQALGMLRQLVLLGGEPSATAQSVLETCGQPRYDLSIDWQQIFTEDTTLSTDFETTAFTKRYQDSTTTAGKLHVAPDGAPELSEVTFDRTLNAETTCTDTSRAWHCVDTKETISAHDMAPEVTACGQGYYAGYTVVRWNADARGDITGPQLALWFQNSFGCAPSSFIVTTRQATDTVEYPRQDRTTTATIGSSDSVNMMPWAGGARLGTATRIVRSSSPATGENVQPGSIRRWSTRLTITVTEVLPSN